MQLLFPNSHPVVKENVEKLKESGSGTGTTTFDLDWDEKPEEEHPKWLRKHWDRMEELEAFLLCFRNLLNSKFVVPNISKQ